MALTTLSSEQIEKYRQVLNEHTPYSEKEINQLELDSKNYDYWKVRAYIAQKALREAGLLEE